MNTTITNHIPNGWRGNTVTWDKHSLPVAEDGRQVDPSNWAAYPHHYSATDSNALAARRTQDHTLHIAVDLSGDQRCGEEWRNTFGWTVYSNTTGQIIDCGIADTLTEAMAEADRLPAASA